MAKKASIRSQEISRQGWRGKNDNEYQKDRLVFSQGDVADTPNIQKGKLKLTVISKQGKEAVITLNFSFLAKDV